MKTIILPGRSLKNKIWAEELVTQMNLSDYTIIEWEPWKNNDEESPLDVELETSKILGAIGSSTVNIVAKSIGTLLAVKIIQTIPDQISKIILCGIPLGVFEAEKTNYLILANFPIEKVKLFQNENDTVGSFQNVKKAFALINPRIEVVSKPRSDHHYPYPEDFKNFLLS